MLKFVLVFLLTVNFQFIIGLIGYDKNLGLLGF